MRDAIRVMRDIVRRERKKNLYDETFAKLDEQIEVATDALIEISQLFVEVISPEVALKHPTSMAEHLDLRALQDSLTEMKAERDELQMTVREKQEQLEKFAADLQKLYAAERDKRQELAKAYAIKADFLSTINHELSSPLVPIDLNLQVMQRGELESGQREQLQEVQEQLTQYKRQLDGVIKYATLVNQTHVLNLIDVEVKPLIETTVEPLLRLAEGREIRVKVREIDEYLTIKADRELLGNLVYQVTHNAIKFNKPGGSVEIKVFEEKNGVSFHFMDDGPGIPDEVLENFGKDFNQLVEAMRRGVEGLGLGLALSNYVANVHGGTLAAQVGEERGTLIALWLPKE